MKNEYTADVATLRQQLTNPPGIGSKLVGQQGEQTGGAVSEDAITEAARALCAESSRACNVDKDDNWNLYADEFKAQARIVVEAVAPLLRAPGETESKVYACPRCATSMQVDPSAKPRAPAERGGMVDEGDIEAMRGAAMEIAHNKEAWFPMTDRRLRRAAEVLVARRAALAQNAQPKTLGDFVRLPDSERVAIGQQVVDRAIEMQNAQGEAVEMSPEFTQQPTQRAEGE